MKNKSIILALATLVSLTAYADDPITLGTPIYGGTGCPQGTASATLSPDGSALSVLFDNYQVEAGGVTGKRLDRKSCNLAIPVHVPQGFSVAVLQVDYRGFNAVPLGGMSQFNVEYFFAGSQGPVLSKRFTGPLNEDYDLSNQLVASTLVWSSCGVDVNLRTNTSLMAMTNFQMEDTMSTVDSADVSASVVYHLQWKRCGLDSGGFGNGGWSLDYGI